MAGTLPGFNADEFRKGIRLAMTMGAPPDEGLQATFFPPITKVGGDAAGVPYGPGQTVKRGPRTSKRVTCAIEFVSGTDVETAVGLFASDRIVVTLLDEEYEQVKGFEFVAYSGVRYRFVKELPVAGLATVAVHRIECRAED